MSGSIYLITGLMASGKSTVADVLARRFEKGVHLRGDIFRKMIVSGRVEMSENCPPEAREQLDMRYRMSAWIAKMYADEGFTVVLQDNYYCEALTGILDMLSDCEVKPVVLCPRVEVIEAREKGRQKTGYAGYSVKPLYDSFMRDTPREGFWIDNSDMTVEETVDAIIEHYTV